MVGLVKLIAVVMIACGAIFLVRPALMKKFMQFWMQESKLYIGAVLSLAIGIIFLFAAKNCTIHFIVVIFGLLSLIKGILIFVLGPKKIIAFMELLSKRPAKALRFFAILHLCLGVLLNYSA